MANLASITIFFLLLTSGFALNSTVRFTPAVEVNENLETDLRCDTDPSTDVCQEILNPSYVSNAKCNMNYKCQCNFQYAPASKQLGGPLNLCNNRKCIPGIDDNVCKGLYKDENMYCSNTACHCYYNMKWNPEKARCELPADYKKAKLGEACTSSNDCGSGTTCPTERRQCSCGIGWKPITEYACDTVRCDSDAFCRGRVTFGSICDNPGSDYARCKCGDDSIDDYETMTCRPRYRKIGETCNSFYGYGCGNGAMCNRQNKCVCFFGQKPSLTSRNCEQIRCLTNTECLTNDENSMCKSGTCSCREDYNIDNDTQVCVPRKRFPAIWIVVMSLALLAILGTVAFFGIRACQRRNTFGGLSNRMQNSRMFWNRQNAQNGQQNGQNYANSPNMISNTTEYPMVNIPLNTPPPAYNQPGSSAPPLFPVPEQPVVSKR